MTYFDAPINESLVKLFDIIWIISKETDRSIIRTYT